MFVYKMVVVRLVLLAVALSWTSGTAFAESRRQISNTVTSGGSFHALHSRDKNCLFGGRSPTRWKIKSTDASCLGVHSSADDSTYEARELSSYWPSSEPSAPPSSIYDAADVNLTPSKVEEILPMVSAEDFRSRKIECVLSDMDGTLLNTSHKVSAEALTAIKRIKELPSSHRRFFPATGRTRVSMAASAGPEFTALFGGQVNQIPGVFSQGLMVCGLDGNVIYEDFLSDEVVATTVEFCRVNGNLAVIAYCGDDIYCQRQNAQTNKITEYSEPIPEEFPEGLENLKSKAGIMINKLILLDTEENIQGKIRPKLEDALQGIASLTRAVPGMLEILPYGASKGTGVQKLLEHLQISAENVLAMGDGENDAEMFQLVGLAVAVDNAKPSLKRVADVQTLSNDDNGVAHVLNLLLERFDESSAT